MPFITSMASVVAQAERALLLIFHRVLKTISAAEGLPADRISACPICPTNAVYITHIYTPCLTSQTPGTALQSTDSRIVVGTRCGATTQLKGTRTFSGDYETGSNMQPERV